MANTWRYSKIKNFSIELIIRAEINYYLELYLRKTIFFINFLFLLAMLLKYSRFKIHIPIEYLIFNNLISKEMIYNISSG